MGKASVFENSADRAPPRCERLLYKQSAHIPHQLDLVNALINASLCRSLRRVAVAAANCHLLLSTPPRDMKCCIFCVQSTVLHR